MDMKRILQAMNGISEIPVEGASSMSKFLRVVKEAEINQPQAPVAPAKPAAAQIKVPEIPQVPAQDGDQGNGEVVKTNADGTRTYSGGFGTFTYDAQGKAIKYSTPNFNGLGQTIDLTNQQTTQNYNSGPMSVSQTTDATGKQVAADTTYDLGVAKLRQQTNATGQNINTAYVPDGDATHVVQENSLSKFLSIVDKNNVSILSEGANPHKVALPVQMAMQHYSKATVTEKRIQKESLISKYFQAVEEDINKEKESRRALINQYANTIAERVMMKESGEAGWNRTGMAGVGVMSNAPDGGHLTLGEMPIEPSGDPNDPTIYGHEKANPMSLKGRIMSARAQLKELSQMADTDDLATWQQITKLHKGGLFMGLAQNLEQISHGINELAAKRRKGGTASRGIDKNIDERSVSQAQARLMAAAAHNPEFAKKVKMKPSVAKDFNQADKGKNIQALPKRVPKK